MDNFGIAFFFHNHYEPPTRIYILHAMNWFIVISLLYIHFEMQSFLLIFIGIKFSFMHK